MCCGVTKTYSEVKFWFGYQILHSQLPGTVVLILLCARLCKSWSRVVVAVRLLAKIAWHVWSHASSYCCGTFECQSSSMYTLLCCFVAVHVCIQLHEGVTCMCTRDTHTTHTIVVQLPVRHACISILVSLMKGFRGFGLRSEQNSTANSGSQSADRAFTSERLKITDAATFGSINKGQSALVFTAEAL